MNYTNRSQAVFHLYILLFVWFLLILKKEKKKEKKQKYQQWRYYEESMWFRIQFNSDVRVPLTILFLFARTRVTLLFSESVCTHEGVAFLLTTNVLLRVATLKHRPVVGPCLSFRTTFLRRQQTVSRQRLADGPQVSSI